MRIVPQKNPTTGLGDCCGLAREGEFTTMLNPRQILNFAPTRDVRFGSKADMCSALGDIR
jgi:hypothetical protein